MNDVPIQPPDAARLDASSFFCAVFDDRTVYFSNMKPFDFYNEDDRPAVSG